MSEGDKTLWLRPADTVEMFLWMAQEAGGLLVSTYGLTLRTKHPLTDTQVKQALTHLYRKVPTLRLCFRERQPGELWACEMDREHINFEVLNRSDQLRLQEELMTFQFNNKEGPLWCARLLQQDSSGGSVSARVESDFPCSRSLVWANHHGIADGTTNNRTVNAFLRILDDVISGREIDDQEQFGDYVSGEETQAMLRQIEDELRRDEGSLKVLAEIERQEMSPKLIPRAYPHPEDPNYFTKIVSRTLDEDTTLRFLKRCKAEGVTVNSAFTVIADVSLVDFVREAGLVLDLYPVQSVHAVSRRRYWKGDVTRALGCHICMMSHSECVSAGWRDDFWGLARELHRGIKKDLDDHKPLRDVAYFLLAERSVEKMLQTRPVMSHDHCFANIGNLDVLIPTDGESVRLGHLVRTTQCWNERSLHMFQSLRGRFIYNYCYTNDLLTENEANRYVDTVLANIEALI